MVKLIDFFRLIRTKNLLIIAISQYLIRYAIIIPMTDSKSLSDLQFFYLVLSTIFIAAAGYIINDYFDTRVDRLNNRKLIIDHTIKRREAILLHFIFSGIGVFLGFFLGWRVGIINLGFINLFCSSALWFYSTHFKRAYLSGNLLIPDGGNIGSASDTDAIAISSGGVVTVSATTANTSASDGALVVGGGVGVGADLTVGDDLRLITDSAVLSFGADSDTTLTHTDGSGLTINSTNKIMFRDSALSVSSSAEGQLDIDADTEVEITATTIDINGAVEISGTTTQTGVSTSAAKDVFNAGLSVKNGSSSAGFIEFFEDSDNGTNKVTLIGPASSGDVTLTLPTTTDTIAVAGDITALAIALG